jgi:hypothetical protein
MLLFLLSIVSQILFNSESDEKKIQKNKYLKVNGARNYRLTLYNKYSCSRRYNHKRTPEKIGLCLYLTDIKNIFCTYDD